MFSLFLQVNGLGELHVRLKKGKDLVLRGQVNNSNDKEYLIQASSPNPIRIQSEVVFPNIHHPVVFIFRTKHSVKSWRIPDKTSVNNSEYSRTFCRGTGDGGNSSVTFEYNI